MFGDTVCILKLLTNSPIRQAKAKNRNPYSSSVRHRFLEIENESPEQSSVYIEDFQKE